MVKTIKRDRKLNKLLSAVVAFLVVFGILFLNLLSLNAAEDKGKLTLRCVFPVGGSERVLANDEYSLVKIADLNHKESGVTFATIEEFKAYDCKWEEQAASKMNEKAEALAYYCNKNALYTGAMVTDEKGELTFDGLETGMYLIARTKTDKANQDFTTDPLLFFVPQNVDGKIMYDITATPKFSYISSGESGIPGSPHAPGSSRSTPSGTLPYTGQLLWPVTVLAVAGSILIFSGYALLRRKGGSDEKKNS